MAFQTPDAAPKPTIIAVGTLKSIGELTRGKSDPQRPDKIIYWSERCEIAGAGGAPNQKFDLRWLPEMFSPKFRMSTLNKSTGFVYAKTIASEDDCSLLQGLCGDKETWESFQSQAESLDEYTPESVHDFLKEFFLTLGPVPFVYELRQERRKESYIDDNGNDATRYRRGKYYELHTTNWLTESYVKSLAKRVERNIDKIAKAEADGTDAPVPVLVKFDPSQYGFDIAMPEPAQPDWVTA